jgi:hypothetical protein
VNRDICVDFDGTIVDFAYPHIGKIKPGVKEALTRLKELGYNIIIYSCRTSRYYPETFTEARNKVTIAEMIWFLKEAGIPYDEVDDGTKGKPFADFYIDDKAVEFKDNWPEIAARIEKEGILKGTPPVGAVPPNTGRTRKDSGVPKGSPSLQTVTR